LLEALGGETESQREEALFALANVAAGEAGPDDESVNELGEG
jgi:hypothetical protein